VAFSAHATLISTDPVTGGRTYRFTPTDADFLDSFSTKWNTNPGAYFHDYDVYEFEESDAPYVFAQNIWVQRHPFLTFRGVKADGSDADPAKVVFAFQTEGTSACFQLESATNSFANHVCRHGDQSARAFDDCLELRFQGTLRSLCDLRGRR